MSWIETKISIKLNLDKISKYLGYLQQDNLFWPLNFFLTVTRHYIFTCAYKHQDPNIYCLQNTMKQKFFEQEMLSRVSNTNKRFEKTWSHWCKILKNDIL